jgi:SpoIIAA-like
MIEYDLDRRHSILRVRPKSALEAADFTRLASAVDPYIEETGDLRGLIVEVSHFPGWDSFGAMASHCRFVRDHHRRIRRIAVVTDSPMGNVAEHLASHFVSAEIRHFPAGSLETAQRWILS